MVDLPRTPLDNSVTQGPQSSVSGGEIRSAFGDLAAGMDNLGQTFENAAIEKASLEGQGAVYTDENGKLKYDSRNPLSRAGTAFNRSARTAYVSQISMDARPAIANLEVEAKGNVGEFDKLSSAYLKEMLKGKDPLLKGAIQSELTGAITSSRTGMIRAQQQRDLQSQDKSISARINMANEDAAQLARSGGTNTREYAEQLDIIRTLEREKVGNPLFAYSQAESDVFLRGVESSHMSESIVGQVEGIYQSKGLKAAQDFAEKSFDDPGLQLSPAERARYRNAARGALGQFKAELKVERDEAREDAKRLKDEMEGAGNVNDEDVDAVARRLEKAGDGARAIQLRRQHANAKQVAIFDDGDGGQRVAMLARVQGGGDSAALLIKQFEGFRETPYFDVNALRTGYGSDTVTRVGGIVEPVVAGTRVSRADAERDLTRRIGNYQAAAREKVGGPEWDSLSKGAKAALTSVAYNYGSLPDRVITAIRTGDNERIALAVEGLAGDNDGINAGRRSQEASIIRGGLGVGIDSKTYAAMKKDVATDMKASWENMKEGLKKGDPLAPDDIDLLGAQLAAVGDREFSDEVVGFLKQTGDYSTDTLANMQKRMQEVEVGGVAADERDTLDMMRARYDQTVKGLAEDPLEFGQRIGMEGVKDIDPIDFSSPAALGAGLGKNIAAARRVAQRYGSATVGVLTKNDAAAFKTVVATGDAQQASTAMMGLTNVPDDLLRGTLEMADVKESIIGASQSRDFDKYSAAVTTMDNLYNRAPQEFARIFGPDAMDTLQDWQGRLRYMNPVELEAEWKRRGDPTYAARQEKLKKDGGELARKIALPDIAADLGGPVPTDGNIAAVMAADHEAMFAQRFAATQNADTARQQAAERMKQHWGPSVTNNGELMLHPPDRYYPRINGNHDWIETELKDELFAAGYGYEVQNPRAGTSRVTWPHMLIADAQTESEAAAGKSPSYRIAVTNPHNGETDLLTDKRYNFDPATIQNAATRKAYDDERASIFEWNPLQKFGLFRLKKPGPGMGW